MKGLLLPLVTVVVFTLLIVDAFYIPTFVSGYYRTTRPDEYATWQMSSFDKAVIYLSFAAPFVGAFLLLHFFVGMIKEKV